MLLVVGTATLRSDHLEALGRDHDVATAPSIAVARHRCRNERFDAVIVDRDLADAAVAWFVWDLGTGEGNVPRTPVIAIASTEPRTRSADERVSPPVDSCELRAAVERAVRVDEYEQAIRRLFSACRGIGRPQRDLGSARERADECLRALDACDEQLPFERLIDA